jgi:hypothetical protein
MENDEIKTKVCQLFELISVHKKELDEIRKKCKHIEFIIGDDPNVESFSLKKVCKHCKLSIGYPTEEEMDDLLISRY